MIQRVVRLCQNHGKYYLICDGAMWTQCNFQSVCFRGNMPCDPVVPVTVHLAITV